MALNLKELKEKIAQNGSVTVLDNGLTVIQEKNPGLGLARASINMQVGSAIEHEGDDGTMHFLEHILMNGSTRFPYAEMRRQEAMLGLSLNAQTGREHVKYLIQGTQPGYILASNLLPSFDMVLDAVVNPRIDISDIERERQIIQRERIQEDTFLKNNVMYPINKHVHDLLHKKNMWQLRKIIGTEGTIDSITQDTLREYHEKVYTAPNMFVQVLGDVSEADMKRIYEMLEYVPPGDLIPRTRYVHNGDFALGSEIDMDYCGKGPTHVGYIFSDTGLTDKEKTHLNLLSKVLGGGLNSLLMEELRHKRGLVYHAGATMDGHSVHQYLSMGYEVDPIKLDDSIEATRTALHRARTGDFDADIILGAQNSLVPGMIYRTRMPGWVLDYVTVRYRRQQFGETYDSIQLIRDFMTAQKDDVVAVANKVLTENHLQVIKRASS